MKTKTLNYSLVVKTILVMFLGLILNVSHLFGQQTEEDTYHLDHLIFTVVDDSFLPKDQSKSKAPALNSIFREYNVIKYERAYPLSRREQLMNRYKVVCENCEIFELEKRLQGAFLNGIENVDRVPKPRTLGGGSGKMLDKIAETSVNTVCPNPFYPFEFPINQPGWRKDLRTTNVPCAWSIVRGNIDIKVAVLDNNFKIDHPELNIVHIDNSAQVVTDPTVDSHGTRSLGAVGTKHNNGWICNTGGNDDGGVGLMLYSHTFNNILKAAIDGADIITNSWGFCAISLTSSLRDDFQNIVNEATEDHNAIILGAAGNANNHFSWCGGTMELVPAALDNVISVSGVDQSNLLFSNPPGSTTAFGHYNYHPTVDICAPSYGITTTCNRTLIPQPGGGTIPNQFCNDWGTGFATGQYWGTSSGTPFTAGVVALMLSENPLLTHDEVKAILRRTAQPFNDYCTAPYVGQVGAGYLDAFAAILETQNVTNTQSSPGAILNYTSTTLCETGSVTLCANKDYGITDWYHTANGVSTFEGGNQCITVTDPGSYSLHIVNSKNYGLHQFIDITNGICCTAPCTYLEEEVILDKSDFTEPDNNSFTGNYNVGMYLTCDAKWVWKGEGSIAFAEDVSLFNDGSYDAADHTNGETSFIIGDASTIADTRAFYVTQDVEPGEIYTYSAWVRNIDPNSPNSPIMELRTESNTTGQVTVLANSGPMAQEDGWIQLCGTFQAAASETVEFQVISLQAGAVSGFDFGVDDVKLTRSYEYNDVSICEGDCFDIGHIGTPNYNYWVLSRDANTGGAWNWNCTSCTLPYQVCPLVDTEYLILSLAPNNACSIFETFIIEVQPISSGCSSWNLTNPNNDNGIGESSTAPTTMEFTIYPNPAAFGNTISVEIGLMEAAEGSIELLDLSGKSLMTTEQTFQAGYNKYALNTTEQNISKGIYFVRLRAGAITQTKKLIISN